MNIKNNNIKICLCAIAKNENRYLREFVEHYQNIGYNKIILYDNNDINGEKFDEVINDYMIQGFVQVINFKERQLNISPQFLAYEDCYSRNTKLFDWLSFFDIDEFLEIDTKYNKIQDFLNDKIFKYCQNIKINWLIYEDSNLLYYEKKPLQERIKIPCYNNSANMHIKSTVKGNLPINYWEGTKNPHSSQLKYKSCSSSGKKISYDSPFNQPPDYTNAKLKHYNIKSFEEYCLKIKRGRSDFVDEKNSQIIEESKKILLFQIHNNTEKMKIYNKIFNK